MSIKHTTQTGCGSSEKRLSIDHIGRMLWVVCLIEFEFYGGAVWTDIQVASIRLRLQDSNSCSLSSWFNSNRHHLLIIIPPMLSTSDLNFDLLSCIDDRPEWLPEKIGLQGKPFYSVGGDYYYLRYDLITRITHFHYKGGMHKASRPDLFDAEELKHRLTATNLWTPLYNLDW